MASTKAALKTIGAAITSAKYDDAVEQSRKLLANDPKNYQANLFLGFALDKQTKLSDAERAYSAATNIKPNDPQAWQGLIKVFEKQGSVKVNEYQNVALNLAVIYRDLDDKYKCQDVVDKFTVFARSQGSRQQQRTALELLLPTSPIYDYLEGRIPHPSHTYESLAQITEADEKERTNKEIGERRTRLGAKINQVTLDVRREVFRDSPLENLYSNIIDWSNDDDIRRRYEEKLLQRCYDALWVLPAEEKASKREKVDKLANDMVIIKHPFKLAWDIAIEWKDNVAIADWDVGVLREYTFFFPESGLSKVLEGFMSSQISPFPAPPPPVQYELSSDESEDEDEGGGVGISPVTAEDRLILMTDGISDAADSLLAHRVMGEYYAYLDEHESVVELMRGGLKLVSHQSQKSGIQFENARQSLTAFLGTALVFYQSPKNHPEAKSLFQDLLTINPTLTPALIGVGLIYEEEEDFPAAIDFLERALHRDPSNVRVRAEAAWIKALNGDYENGRHDLEACLLDMDIMDVRSRELRAQTQYRIGVCIWNVEPSKSARKDRKGAYACFMAAVKSSLTYAPAYTSLGIIYSDYLKDKKRARKCFQKAFELSSSEVEAAERLARGFAIQKEWDLVEVVAQRVVDSGKVKAAPGSKKKGISWPYAALGVAEVNKQDYAKSIVSFQAALRIKPNDYHSWVGLGESYHNSGRYIAATKAFTHAEKFEQDVKGDGADTWFAKYMLANVKRELGEYDEAIRGYRAVLNLRPAEFGVSIALVQTLVEGAWRSVDQGLFGQAVELAGEAVQTARGLVSSHSSAFNLWKSVGDACSIFSWVQDRLANFPYENIKQIIQDGAKEEAFELFFEVDGVSIDTAFADGLPSDDDEAGFGSLTRCLQAGILCHKSAIYASSSDVHAQAVAYYNLGWTEYRSHVCLRAKMKKTSTGYLKAAVRSFKRAIELEAGNGEFWNALGVVTTETAPKVAQHSLVRSLYLNERSAQAWTNLGTLYLFQNDLQLANETFTRAQSTDPEYAHAWLGQGLVALLLGDPKEARLLFKHAMEISESSSLLTKRQYALSTFDHLLSSSASTSINDLVQPIFALNQLHSLAPSDITYQHLATMFLERVEDVTASLSMLAVVCTKMEADYEVTESPASLSKFALAKADLARSQLAAGYYNESIESGETSLQLSAEDAGNELSKEDRQRCRLSAHLSVGLAHYHSHNTKEAVEYLEMALEEAEGNPDAVCLLAQILWATGDDTSRSKARDHLFDCVENNPGHVQSVILLGTVALLDNDAESVEAVTEDLQTLRMSEAIGVEERAMVGEILRAVAALSDGDCDQAILAEVQSEVFLFPDQPHGWNRLASFTGDEYAAAMALKTAIRSAPPRGMLDAVDLSEAFAGTGKLGDAQKSIMFAPWSLPGWAVLGAAASG